MTDEQAFADFVRHRATTLYRFGYVLAGNHHDAVSRTRGMDRAEAVADLSRLWEALVALPRTGGAPGQIVPPVHVGRPGDRDAGISGWTAVTGPRSPTRAAR